MKMLCYGSLNLDRIYRVRRFGQRPRSQSVPKMQEKILLYCFRIPANDICPHQCLNKNELFLRAEHSALFLVSMKIETSRKTVYDERRNIDYKTFETEVSPGRM